jgi:Sec7-like guanine-nucleotide exchange factor
MALARETTQEEAESYTTYDLLVKLGRASTRSGEAIEKAKLFLKKMWTDIIKLGKTKSPLISALRRATSTDDVDELLRIIAEITGSLESLTFDLKAKKKQAEEWATNHPGRRAG